jgi:hypothetical protein
MGSGDIGESVSSITGAISSAAPSEKLILFGGFWGTLAFFSNFLDLPVEAVGTGMAIGAVVMLIGFAGAFYGKQMQAAEAKEVRLAEIASQQVKPELSRGDLAMLAAMEEAGSMREHDIFNLPFPYDDKATAKDIRGKYKLLRVRFLTLGGHIDETAGDYTPISGGDKTIMAST